MDAVTHVLLDRAAEPSGFRRMLSVSFLVHGLVIAMLALFPAFWLGHRQAEAPVMTITLGGSAPGPYTGGMTALGGRATQAVAPLQKVPQAVRPPAEKTPEMTLPVPKPKAAKPRPEVKEAPEKLQSWNRQPVTGQKIQAGSSIAETGATGQGFGLSTGGGGTGGFLDVKNFCCPEYISTMEQTIQANWSANQEVPGKVMVHFTISRNGTISDVQLETSSGYEALDLNAQRAVVLTRQLPPLPAQYPNATLGVHLSFEYKQHP
ncbi:MAG TPA: TonB family protein [Vicinamibacterales bacterium]|jgi:TonB family protein